MRCASRQVWKIAISAAVVMMVVLAGILIIKLVVRQEVEEVPEVSEVVEEDSQDQYGYVEPVTVGAIVEKYKQHMTEQGEGVVHENNYWYPLYEDVALVVVPVEFSGDLEKDIVLVTLIYTDKESVNREKALEYLGYLIQANDDVLSMDEVAGLISEAEGLRERGEMANRGKGIFVAINEVGDHVEYQVVRNYRDNK